jgi:hypothetical protein
MEQPEEPDSKLRRPPLEEQGRREKQAAGEVVA